MKPFELNPYKKRLLTVAVLAAMTSVTALAEEREASKVIEKQVTAEDQKVAETDLLEKLDVEKLDFLKEVVVSATRTEQDVFDVANTVTTISDKDIEEQMPADIKDLLRYETGVSVRSEPNRASAVFRATGRAGNEGINIRGLEGNQVLLQADGVRLPSGYDSGPFAAGRGDYIDMEAYKRVEILRGPSSTQYGSDGLAGAVSFITKDPKDLLTLGKPWQAALKVRYSSVDNSWTTVPSFAYGNDVVEAMVLASMRNGNETDNMGDNHAHNITRTAPNPEDNKSEYILAKLVVKPNQNHKFKFTVEDFDRKVDTNVLTFFGDPFTVPTLTGVDLKEDITRQLFKLDYDYSNDENRWFQRATTSVYKQDSENRQIGRETRSTNPVLRIRDTNYVEDVVGGSFQLESNFGDKITHHLTYGVDASSTEVSSERDGFNSTGAVFRRNKNFPDTDYKLFGAFVQNEIGISQFSIIPGVRYDKFKLTPHADALYRVNSTTVPAELKGSEVSPKLGVIWKLDPLFSPFAQYAHGFRAPQPVQVNNGFSNLLAANPYTTIGNTNLKPETSNSVEFGIRGHSNTLRYSASAFKGRYKDFIASNVQVETNPAPIPDVFQSINFGSVEISGFELRGEWAFIENWSTSASYAHAKGDSKSGGVKTPLASIDPDKLVLGLRYDNNGKYGANLFATIVERKNRNPNPTANYTSDGYEVFDLTGYYQFNDHVSVNTGLFNMFDRKYFAWSDVRNLSPTYQQIDAYSQPGRNAAVSVKYQF